MMLGINGCPELTFCSCIFFWLDEVGDRGTLVSRAVKKRYARGTWNPEERRRICERKQSGEEDDS